MAHPNYIQKTLTMKPEVSKIFEDLEAWLDHCRLELIKFDPKDLYNSKEYREFTRSMSADKKREANKTAYRKSTKK